MSVKPGDSRLPVEMSNTRFGRGNSAPLTVVTEAKERRTGSASPNNRLKRLTCFLAQLNSLVGYSAWIKITIGQKSQVLTTQSDHKLYHCFIDSSLDPTESWVPTG
jgi:hypothetical protein